MIPRAETVTYKEEYDTTFIKLEPYISLLKFPCKIVIYGPIRKIYIKKTAFKSPIYIQMFLLKSNLHWDVLTYEQ